MKLVVVESPSKVKTIEKYLGKEYKALASVGHIADLPKSTLGVDVDKNFEIDYVVTKEASLNKLKEAYKKADELILAVDLDREGEAIGWHVAQLLGVINKEGEKLKTAKPVSRIVFSEITKEAVQEALKHPRKININLVNAQQARRVLDRLVGYKLSPLLWKKIRFGLSAGRVQSVALRLIVDREIEREAFNADEYWSIQGYVDSQKNARAVKATLKLNEDEKIDVDAQLIKFELKQVGDKKAELTKQSEVESILSKVGQKEWKISAINSKNAKRTPKPPFTTSTLQQAAANRLGYSSKNTMRIAQKLYEAGHITYMRTDSVAIADSAVQSIRKYIGKQFGEKFLPAGIRYYSANSKTSQEAHECVRPTTFNKIPADLTPDEGKLYKLIRDRAIASQMADALVENSSLTSVVAGCTFQANGQRILFPGFLKVYSESLSENILPELQIGDSIYLDLLVGNQHFTQPPARYTEATLIKALEMYGIGRPSTYASIISTIEARKYVEREGRAFKPTDVGRVVTKLLVKHFANIVDTDFTSHVEGELDDIAEGKKDWVEMMYEFYTPFAKNLAKKEDELKREDFTVLAKSDQKCPECKKPMVVKLGKNGKFLSCSDFPKCKGIRSMDGRTEADMAKEAYEPEFLAKYKPAPKTDDGADYLLKNGRFGQFWAHPGYPKVKDAKPLEYTDKIFKQLYGTAPKSKDGKKMILRRGKFGEFWAHPKYPDVKEVSRINQKELKAKKAELGLI